MTPTTHDKRIARLRTAFDEAHRRLRARLMSAPPGDAARAPAAGGWSAIQIGWHVAKVNDAFAGLISGERAGATPLPEGFQERPWREIAATIPERLEAGSAVQPPETVGPATEARDEMLAALSASAERLSTALDGLTEARGGGHGVAHRTVGLVTVYQIGEWATAHVIRHNQQAKRVLGS